MKFRVKLVGKGGGGGGGGVGCIISTTYHNCVNTLKVKSAKLCPNSFHFLFYEPCWPKYLVVNKQTNEEISNSTKLSLSVG